MLANQQEDGDGLIQNIVTNLLGEERRKSLTEGLRDFIQVDNHRALQVGHLKEGLTSFKVRRPKGEDGHPEVSLREGPDELTLGAQERALGSRASMSTTLQQGGEVFLWWMLIGTPSAKSFTTGSLQRIEQGCGS